MITDLEMNAKALREIAVDVVAGHATQVETLAALCLAVATLLDDYPQRVSVDLNPDRQAP